MTGVKQDRASVESVGLEVDWSHFSANRTEELVQTANAALLRLAERDGRERRLISEDEAEAIRTIMSGQALAKDQQRHGSNAMALISYALDELGR